MSILFIFELATYFYHKPTPECLSTPTNAGDYPGAKGWPK